MDYEAKLATLDLNGLAAGEAYIKRCKKLIESFKAEFGGAGISLFSAPGRVEIGGNHTDHQRGCVLAAAINLDALGAAAPNNTGEIRLLSRGYPLCSVSVGDLSPREEDEGTTTALVRGVAEAFTARGAKLGGFDACLSSGVLKGSGLSSSAAFEVFVATVINGLFCGESFSPVDIAIMSQYAENVHFGKPSGLEDQTASAFGGVVSIDFKDPKNPVVKKMEPSFNGHALCVIDSGASHADLTPAYASIPEEMALISGYFGHEYLREVDETAVIESLPGLREKFGDRPVLRALHFFADNKRAADEASALSRGDFTAFLSLVNESGRSSYMYLQNVIADSGAKEQSLAVTLALCDEFLGGRGAFRMQGGGFAGTVEAFVPEDMLTGFKAKIEAALGGGSCHVLSVRPLGALRLF